MTQPNQDARREEPRPLDEPVSSDSAVPPVETVPADQSETSIVEKPAEVRGESRFGRFLRAALRTLLLLAIVFGLGALTVYLLLYRPVIGQLEAARQEASQAAERLEQAEQNLEQAQSDLELANGREEEASEQLEVEMARVQVLRAMNELTRARMALTSKDPDGAVKALTASEAYLKEIAPTLKERDPAQLETLEALYMLAKNDITRDAKLAQLDLDRLQTELDVAEKNVLQ